MSQQEHPNATLVRQGFEALERGDMNWLQEHLADDVVWHVGGKSVMAGDYRGKDEVLNNFIGRQVQATGGPPNVTLTDIVGNDRHVVAFGDAVLDDPDGGSVSWKFANIFRVTDGKAQEVWGLADETSESDVIINKLLG
jgi:ketosteroid isomerase-like protein